MNNILKIKSLITNLIYVGFVEEENEYSIKFDSCISEEKRLFLNRVFKKGEFQIIEDNIKPTFKLTVLYTPIKSETNTLDYTLADIDLKIEEPRFLFRWIKKKIVYRLNLYYEPRLFLDIIRGGLIEKTLDTSKVRVNIKKLSIEDFNKLDRICNLIYLSKNLFSIIPFSNVE